MVRTTLSVVVLMTVSVPSRSLLTKASAPCGSFEQEQSKSSARMKISGTIRRIGFNFRHLSFRPSPFTSERFQFINAAKQAWPLGVRQIQLVPGHFVALVLFGCAEQL